MTTRKTAKFRPATFTEWVLYVVIFALVQPGVIYFCLRVLHWDLIFPAFLGSALAVLSAVFVIRRLRIRRARRERGESQNPCR